MASLILYGINYTWIETMNYTIIEATEAAYDHQIICKFEISELRNAS